MGTPEKQGEGVVLRLLSQPPPHLSKCSLNGGRPAASISRHSLIFAHAKTFLELNVLGTSPGSYQIRYALT